MKGVLHFLDHRPRDVAFLQHISGAADENLQSEYMAGMGGHGSVVGPRLEDAETSTLRCSKIMPARQLFRIGQEKHTPPRWHHQLHDEDYIGGHTGSAWTSPHFERFVLVDLIGVLSEPYVSSASSSTIVLIDFPVFSRSARRMARFRSFRCIVRFTFMNINVVSAYLGRR